jgi:hypothetical protein
MGIRFLTTLMLLPWSIAPLAHAVSPSYLLFESGHVRPLSVCSPCSQ